MPKQTRQPSPRFGIAVWFGRDILDLTPKKRSDWTCPGFVPLL
jgi:hypothetical protein